METSNSYCGSHNSCQQKKLFQNLSAWFSLSVKKERIQTWLNNGGVQGDNSSTFLFSEQADHEDTKWIYDLPDYEKEIITVFHPAFIDACVSKGKVSSVNVSHYILPSPEVQEEISREYGDIDYSRVK